MTTTAIRYRAMQHKVASLPFPKIHWKAVSLAGLVCSLVMVVWYIYLINDMTRGSYVVRNYNKQIYTLTEQNRVLETNFAQTGFLGSIQEKVKALSFEKTTQVNYIQLLNVSLAVASSRMVK